MSFWFTPRTGPAVLLTVCAGLIGVAPALAVPPVMLNITTRATTDSSDSFSDAATLSEPPSGDPAPTGTVTFNVYGLDNTTCTGVARFNSTNPVSADGVSAASNAFIADAAGTYQFTASYSGDSTYAPAVSECGAAGASVTLPLLPVSMATQASLMFWNGVGFRFSDTATLASVPVGLPAPTGTVTFNVYGPIGWPFSVESGDCAGTPLFTSTNPVAANSSATSNTFVPVETGARPQEMYLLTASYSGDGLYATAAGECGAVGESVTLPSVALAGPEIGPPEHESPSPTGSSQSISHLSFSPAEFVVARGAKLRNPIDAGKHDPRGTTITYVLARATMVVIAISKDVAGLNIAGRGCLPATLKTRTMLLQGARGSRVPALLRKARCTASKRLGAITRAGKAGSNRVAFDGRLASGTLTAGSYLARATVSSGSLSAGSASATFRVLSR